MGNSSPGNRRPKKLQTHIVVVNRTRLDIVAEVWYQGLVSGRKIVGESLIPPRIPKEDTEPHGHVDTKTHLALTFNVSIFEFHEKTMRLGGGNSYKDLVVEVEGIKPGQFLYLYKLKAGGYTLSKAKLHKKVRKKLPPPPMYDKPTSSQKAKATQREANAAKSNCSHLLNKT